MKVFNLTNQNVAYSTSIIMLIFVFSAIVFSGLGNLLQMYNSNKSIHIASAQQMSDSSIDSSGMKITPVTASNGGGESNTIQLGVTEQQEVYRWSNSSNEATNPTLEFIVNRDNIVQIQNPTDAEHEMIVESQQGNELATSGDIEPNSSGELSISPNMTGTLQYYCEYHPTTMKGTIEVSDG